MYGFFFAENIMTVPLGAFVSWIIDVMGRLKRNIQLESPLPY